MKGLSPEEIVMLKNAISTHVSQLLRDVDGYKKQRNTEAIQDINQEVRKYNELKEKL